jgi:hypothetical protein
MRHASTSLHDQQGGPAITTAFLGVLTIFLSVCFAVLGLTLVQQRVPSALRQEHNDVAGFIYAVLGVMYAVILGFVAIAVWEDFEEAKKVTHTEANTLFDIYGLADQFPQPKRRRVQDLVRSYAQTVLDEEWTLMRDGQSSPQAQALMNDIRQSIEEFEPTTGAEQVIYAQQLSLAQDLADARELRLVEINEGIPLILHGVLLIGGIITVAFTYVFGLKNTWSHMVMVAALTVIIAFILFTINSLEHPFSGDVRVTPAAFELMLRRL